MHKAELHGLDNSSNLVFLLSIGADPIIRVWDFDYLLRGPGSNQTIFGHLNNINSIVFH
jgi:hypothetical protein